MKKYLITGLATAGFVLAATGSAWASDHGSITVEDIYEFDGNGEVAVSLAALSNTSTQEAYYNSVYSYDDSAFQGVKYGKDTFRNMAGINSNGVGVNAATGQSQVKVNAAAEVNLQH